MDCKAVGRRPDIQEQLWKFWPHATGYRLLDDGREGRGPDHRTRRVLSVRQRAAEARGLQPDSPEPPGKREPSAAR